MTISISNLDDVIDSRDVIERIKELEDSVESGDADEDEKAELKTLKALAEEASGSPDWEYGETLIRDTYFQEYAQDLAEDCDLIPTGLTWPCTCIDWELAAKELKYDYFSVDFGGIDYWIRG